MECGVCQVRSSTGYCAECRTLLCDECSTKCERCGKAMCPSHVHETHSGRILCGNCMKERQERKAKQKSGRHAQTVEEEPQAVVAVSATEAVEEDEGVILTASVRRPTPPWKMSLYTSGIACLIGLVILIFPSFRNLWQPWPAVMVIAVAVLSIGWAGYGIVRGQFLTELTRCLSGLMIAVIAIVLAIMAMWLPTRRTDQEVDRKEMSREELSRYRQESLGMFTRPTSKSKRTTVEQPK